MPKVCMMTYAMPPEHSGAARQALTLASGLAVKGVEIFFLTQGNILENLKSRNFAGFRIIRVYKETLIWKMLAPIRFFGVLLRERRNFELIHVHGVGYMAKIAVIFGLLFRKKVLIKMTMYGEDDAVSIKKGSCGVVNFLFFSLASHYVALTQSFYQSCLAAGIPAAKVSLIPNGVNTERFNLISPVNKAALRLKLKIPTDKKVLVYAGIIRPEKGIDLLLDMISLISSERNDLVLLLLGPIESWLPEAETRSVLATLARINSLSNKGVVLYPGNVENVNEYFQASDIFVSASLREGLQNVLLEAMACGLPSVVVEIPEVHKNIIADQVDGFIITERQAKLFSDKILLLIENDKLSAQVSAAARRKVCDCYSISTVVERYLKLYQDLTSCSRGFKTTNLP